MLYQPDELLARPNQDQYDDNALELSEPSFKAHRPGYRLPYRRRSSTARSDTVPLTVVEPGELEIFAILFIIFQGHIVAIDESTAILLTPKPLYSSPYFHPLAMLIGGLSSFLHTCTFTAFAVLHPLLLLEPSWGIVRDSTGRESVPINASLNSHYGIFPMIAHSNVSADDASRVSLMLGTDKMNSL
jgi:hypothetical protein